MSDHDEHMNPEDEGPSKSQRKRDMHALQALGLRLTAVSEDLLAACQLGPELAAAIAEFKRLPNKHEARRRQLQFIGKLMRKADIAHIEAVLAASNQNVELEKAKFRHLEALRDTLLADEAQELTRLVDNNPGLDVQYLRQLIRQARREQKQGKSPIASRKLFRYLRAQLPDDELPG